MLQAVVRYLSTPVRPLPPVQRPIFHTKIRYAPSCNNVSLHHSRNPTTRDMSKLPDCQVCSKIMSVFKAADHLNDYGHVFYDLGKLSGVMSMPCPHAGSIRKLWASAMPYSAPTPEPWSLEISYSRSEPVMIRFINGEQIISYDVGLVANDEPDHPGTSILLDSQWIDPSVPRHWYSQCRHQHRSECDEPNWMKLHPRTNADPDWLIDVMNQCIVPFSSDTSNYVTLSYTWGNVRCLKTNSSNLKRLREPFSIHSRSVSNISQTVRDAMAITEYLGERYLWVDSLCIVQDDENSLSKNLSAMHRIYANSALCLVAYAGTDANYGLRGLERVSAPRHLEHITLDIAGAERLSYFDIPHVFLGSTVHSEHFEQIREPTDEGLAYNHRGWTYQEFIFAKRRLVFTDGPLRWLCGKTKLGEEIRDKFSWGSWIYEMAYTHWVDDRLPSLQILSTISSEYNMRHFRYQTDVLRAFLGIQNHLEGVFDGGLNHGHPEMFFDISLAWTTFKGVTRRIASADVSPEEANLPSWSWMGWHGESYFPGDAEYSPLSDQDGFTEPVAEWFAMTSPSPSPLNMRPVNCKWHHYKTLFESDPSQVLDGWEVYALTSGSLLSRVASGSLLCRIASGPSKKSSYYPVPVPSATETTQSVQQWRFLFSKTSRCHFVINSVVPSMFEEQNLARLYIGLCSSNGGFAGFLHLHQVSEIDRFIELETVELVAVAKGWTTELNDCLRVLQEQDEVIATKSPSPAPKRYSPGGSPEAKTRHECYFVLCIEWEDGVAKRQASGKVFTEVWERYQEPVDLILG